MTNLVHKRKQIRHHRIWLYGILLTEQAHSKHITMVRRLLKTK